MITNSNKVEQVSLRCKITSITSIISLSPGVSVPNEGDPWPEVASKQPQI